MSFTSGLLRGIRRRVASLVRQRRGGGAAGGKAKAVQQLMAEGSYAEAEPILTARLQRSPGNPAPLRQLVRCLDEMNKVAEAETWQRRMLEVHPADDRIAAALMSRLVRLWRYEEAIALGQSRVSQGVLGEQLLLQLTRAYIGGRGAGEAHSALVHAASGKDIEQVGGVALSDILMAGGRFHEARALLLRLARRVNASRFVLKEAKGRLQRLDVFDVSTKIIQAVPVSGGLRGVSVLITHGSPLAHLWMIPLAADLRRRGYATVILERNAAPAFPASGISEIDALHGILDANRVRLRGEEGEPRLRRAWTIDVEAEKVQVDGINMYRAISARIGTKLRSYRFDWQHPLARSILTESAHRADAAFEVCEYIHRQIARQGLRVRFMGGMSHYPPAALYRRYCDQVGRNAGMEYIAFTAGYEHYYTNLKNSTSTALSVANMTRHPSLNMPSRVTRESFERWMSRVPDKQALIADTMKIVAYDRAGRKHSPEAAAIKQRVQEHRSRGGKVVCLFGKILYDLWMDEPGGPAHRDIADWLNHTIASVGRTDTLLLIKPHPNEVKRIIARPTERFLDLVDSDAGKNVVFLDHAWFNMDDVASMIDLGLIWSGTAGLELQACGVPVVVASHWGLRDHPVRFFAPRSKPEYEAMLADPGACVVDPHTRDECALLIKYYASEEVLVPHRFGTMPYLRGVDVGGVRWSAEKVEDFIVNSDSHVARLAERVE